MRDLQIIELFCTIDDFSRYFEPEWRKVLIEYSTSNRWWTTREKCLSLSEVMTIAVLFHVSGSRTFKQFYLLWVKGQLARFFPSCPSYGWFVRILKSIVVPLLVLSRVLLKDSEGVAFVDSTILTVCHIKRASSHKVFKGAAAKGKTSTGWFFGFKLHVVINHRGELVSYLLTPGNVDDRKPVGQLAEGLTGKIFRDRGYISSVLVTELLERGLHLVTRIRANMKNRLMLMRDRLLLQQRGLIESVFNVLKNGCQIEHHRHRCRENFLTNLFAGLIAYSLRPNKPRLRGGKVKLSLG